MTRILVDLLFYTGRRGGMESYVRRLYREMAGDRHELIALASREVAAEGAPWFPGEVVPTGIVSSSRIAWTRGELTAVTRAAKDVRADVVHCPANIGPWTGRTPVVLTLHDLLPFRHPGLVPGPYGPALRTLVRGSARHASRLVTSSTASRDDIVAILGIEPSRIDVVPLGADPVVPDGSGPRRRDLLFALGNRLPHKNWPRLLEALALIPAPQRPRLVLAGGPRDDPLAPIVSRLGLADDVELLAWAPASRIEELYATATAVVVPSLFEGFGLPVLEAMSRGCPVLCADIPVLHEVGGDAAMYFDPTDPASIARCVLELLDRPDAAAALAARGAQRVPAYSWGRTADAMVEVFARAAGA